MPIIGFRSAFGSRWLLIADASGRTVFTEARPFRWPPSM